MIPIKQIKPNREEEIAMTAILAVLVRYAGGDVTVTADEMEAIEESTIQIDLDKKNKTIRAFLKD